MHMSNQKNLKLENAILRAALSGEHTLISPAGDGGLIIQTNNTSGISAITVTKVDDFQGASDIVKSVDANNVVYAELPPFEVRSDHPMAKERKLDIGPTLFAAWIGGDGFMFDDICSSWHTGNLASASIAFDAFFRAETGVEIETPNAYETEVTLPQWANMLKSSDDEEVQNFGERIARSLKHLENHDIDGDGYEDWQHFDVDNTDDDEKLSPAR